MRGSKTTVLIIDATARWAEWASATLGQAGFTAHVVAQIEDLEQRTCESCRIALIDVAQAQRRPDILRKLVNSGHGQSRSVVVMFPLRRRLEVSPLTIAILKSGADCIGKPFDRERLIDVIANRGADWNGNPTAVSSL